MTRVILGAMTALAMVVGAGQVGGAPEALAGGGGCHSPYTDGAGTRVKLEMNCFVPTVLHAAQGATIEFVSSDEWDHTVTGSAQSWGGYESVAFGQTVMQRFDDSGVYVYFCLLHPGMTGAIVVGDGSGPGPAQPAAGSAADAGAPPDANAPERTGATKSGAVVGTSGWTMFAAGAAALLVLGMAAMAFAHRRASTSA